MREYIRTVANILRKNEQGAIAIMALMWQKMDTVPDSLKAGPHKRVIVMLPSSYITVAWWSVKDRHWVDDHGPVEPSFWMGYVDPTDPKVQATATLHETKG